MLRSLAVPVTRAARESVEGEARGRRTVPGIDGENNSTQTQTMPDSPTRSSSKGLGPIMGPAVRKKQQFGLKKKETRWSLAL